jgi:hypothetical protein
MPDQTENDRAEGGFMKRRFVPRITWLRATTLLAAIFALSFALPLHAGNKKKPGSRALIERMEAVPCGAKEHGVTGLGSVWASVGITSVNSDQKLCPQYLLRTDDMEYHVRPLDHKHPILLPIGQESEFKISKDVIEMSIPTGDHKKRRYQVVAMTQINHNDSAYGGDYGSQVPDDRPANGANGTMSNGTSPNQTNMNLNGANPNGSGTNQTMTGTNSYTPTAPAKPN